MPGWSEGATPRRAILRRGALFFAALFVAFAVGELAARWRIEGGLLPALASVAGGRGPWAGPPDAPLVPDPNLGYVLNPAQPGINAFGFRGPAVAPGPHPGVERILVLGDSVAYDSEGFPDLLRDRLARRAPRAFEVLNAAVPGYTTHQERLYFERRLAPLEPDLVLLQYCLNDNHRFLHAVAADGRRLLSPEARRVLLADGTGWFAALVHHSYLLVEARRRLLRRRLEGSAGRPWEAREDLAPAWRDESWPEFAAELAALRDAVAGRGGKLVVAAFPIEDQLDAERLAKDRDETVKPQRELARACAGAGVPLIDLFEGFRAAAARGEKSYLDGMHLSPTGHARAAEVLEARLPL